MSRIHQIIEAYIGDTQPKNIRKKFAEWLSDNQNRAEKNELLFDLWNELDMEADASTEESFRKLQDRMIDRAKKRKITFRFRKLSQIAAVLMLILLSSATAYLYLTKDKQSGEVNLVECIVPKGETRTVILPDSSQVQLNAGSILVYPEKFGKTRNVYINGEGYFSVVHNDNQAFIVKSADMEVEVLGTVFNVASYIDSETSSATLESGKVNVHFKNQSEKWIQLYPNEHIVYDRASGVIKKQTIDVNNIIAWTKGNLIIQRMSIEEIAQIIERKYGMEVHINSKRYQNETITMKWMDGEEISEFMQVLKYLIPDLQYKIEKEKLYIY